MKTSSLALAALLLTGSMVAPVLAAGEGAFDSDWYVTQLQKKGVNAVDAHEGWNGNFRATVVLADGSTVFQYFDDETLQPVGASAKPATRVLSKTDVGARAAFPNPPVSLVTTADSD